MALSRWALLVVLASAILLAAAVPALAAPGVGDLPGAASLAARGAVVPADLPTYVLDSVANASRVAAQARLAGGRATVLYAVDADPAALSAAIPQAGVGCERYVAPPWQQGIVSYALLLPDGTARIGSLTTAKKQTDRAALDSLTTLLNEAEPTMLAEAALTADATTPAYRYVQSSGRYWVDTPSYGRLAFWFSGKMVWNDGSDTQDYWLSHWYFETYPASGAKAQFLDATLSRVGDETVTGCAPDSGTYAATVPVTLGYGTLFVNLDPLTWTYAFKGTLTSVLSETAATWRHEFDPIGKASVAAKNASLQPGFMEIVPQSTHFAATLTASMGWTSKRGAQVFELPVYTFRMDKPVN